MDNCIGVTFNDFVIMASDMAENFSIIKFSERSNKIQPLTSNTALAMSGAPGDSDQFSRFVRCNFELEKFRDDGWEVSPERAFHWITWQLAQSIRSRSPYEVFPILGGYDHQLKKGRIFWMDYLGTGVEVTYGAHGYGESFATGFLDRYHKPNMPREMAIELVKGALDAIQTRIVVSQNRFQMVLIDKDGIHNLPDHIIDRVKCEPK